MGLEDQLIQQFDVHDEDGRNRRWKEWTSKLDRYISIKGVKDDKVKKDYLFFLGGSDLERIYKQYEKAEDTFETIKKTLEEHFTPKYDSKVHMLQFRELHQLPGEPFEEFVSRLRTKAKSCAFKDEDDQIWIQILQRCSSEKLKRKLLESTTEIKLDHLIKMGKLEENVNVQLEEFKRFNDSISAKTEINRVQNKSKPETSKNKLHDTREVSKEKKCFNCGLKYPHEGTCPAKGRKCNNCGKLNHFSKVCKNGKSSVKRIENQDEYEYSSGNLWRVMMRKVSKFVNNVMMPIVCLFICGSSIRFGVDTGANVIDQKTYNRLRFKPKLVKADTCLYGNGSKNRLSLVGRFKTRVKFKSEYRNVMFYVTSGDFGNLLNYDTIISVFLKIIFFLDIR